MAGGECIENKAYEIQTTRAEIAKLIKKHMREYKEKLGCLPLHYSDEKWALHGKIDALNRLLGVLVNEYIAMSEIV